MRHRVSTALAGPSNDDFRFAELLAAFRPYLLAIADAAIGSGLGGKDSPSDLVQDTLLAAHRDRNHFDGSRPEELRAWLRAILSCRIAQLRRARRGPVAGPVCHAIPLDRIDISAGGSGPLSDAQHDEESAAVSELLEHLSEAQRRIVVSRVEAGETFGQIGRRLGMTEGAVRMAWVRALKQLRGLLDLTQFTAARAKR